MKEYKVLRYVLAAIIVVILAVLLAWSLKDEDTTLVNMHLDETLDKVTDNTSNRDRYKLFVNFDETLSEGQTATLTVDDSMIHIKSNTIDAYLDRDNNVTYALTDDGWYKSLGVYGQEFIPPLNEIKDELITDSTYFNPEEGLIRLKTDSKEITLSYDIKKLLTNEITIRHNDNNAITHYKYDFENIDKVTLPEDAISNAIDTSEQ